jgi:hypothetical protein
MQEYMLVVVAARGLNVALRSLLAVFSAPGSMRYVINIGNQIPASRVV